MRRLRRPLRKQQPVVVDQSDWVTAAEMIRGRYYQDFGKRDSELEKAWRDWVKDHGPYEYRPFPVPMPGKPQPEPEMETITLTSAQITELLEDGMVVIKVNNKNVVIKEAE